MTVLDPPPAADTSHKIAVYRMTSAAPEDGPLVTIDGTPVRAHAVRVAARHTEAPEPGPAGSVLFGASQLESIDVTLRVPAPEPRGFGELPTPIMVATVTAPRPWSGTDLPAGGYLDAGGSGSWLEVGEDPTEPGRVRLLLDGESLTLHPDEAWTFLTEVAAIIGRVRALADKADHDAALVAEREADEQLAAEAELDARDAGHAGNRGVDDRG